MAPLAPFARSLALTGICALTLQLGTFVSSHAADAPEFSEAELEFFEKEVRPLLAERCYECHRGGTEEEPSGGLRLDSRVAIVAGGDTGPAIVPGDAKNSLLIDAINYGDLYEMPPQTKLPPPEIAILTKWVEMGAPWPPEAEVVSVAKEFDLDGRRAEHWCWQPLRNNELPSVTNKAWPAQDLDRFILAGLESQGLQPAAEADKRTLLRRAYFDLVGLPPTIAEIEEFMSDSSDDAFASVIDHLLDSPQFGERWARHWLDLVRYAETYGHEFDYPIPSAYRYRDYVIRALNRDVPYDQFVIEHIAGDLLEQPRRHPTSGFNESIIGTGFWWLGEATHAPVDVRGDEAGRVDNQIDVMCKTFLGLTVACARCHDHKFDAISTRDYYSLAGFLQSSRRQEAYYASDALTRPALDRIQEHQRAGSRALVQSITSSDFDGRRFSKHLLEMLSSASGTSEDRSEAETGADAGLKELSHPLHGWWLLSRSAAEDRDDPEAVGRVRGELEQKASDATAHNAELPVLADFGEGAFSDWSATGKAFGDSASRAGEWDPVSQVAQLRLPGWADSGRLAPGLNGVLRSPTFELSHPNLFYKISGKDVRVRLIIDGYFMDVYNALLFKGFFFDLDTEGEVKWQRQARDVKRYVGRTGYLEIIDNGEGTASISQIVLSDGEAPRDVPSRLTREALRDSTSLAEVAQAYGRIWDAALQSLRTGTADAEQTELINWALRHGLLSSPDDRLSELRSRISALSDTIPAENRVLAMTDGTPENEHVFIRGNHKILGPEAPRQFLTALAGTDPQPAAGMGRLELAHQLVDPTNPLVSRVIVNRVWHHLFGRGIVPSVDNFGVLGQPPSHPELLDYLAAEFIREGWSLKSLIRTLMLSRAYQMSSVAAAESESVDPENRLLHHMRTRRLQGEVIRDSILALSGQLDRTMFGPSVPVHVTSFMQGRGRPRKSGPLDGDGRRSLYLQVRRNFLSPFMLAFDTPIPFNTMGRRNTSNVPAQALILMNDPFVVQQAAHWASSLPVDRQSPAEVIEQMYLSAFTRPPTSDERSQALAFLQQQSEELGYDGPADQLDHQAWADLAHVLWNVKEFVYLK